jgi:hypothetical protein
LPRLLQGGQIARERLVAKLREREAGRLFFRRATGHQLLPPIIEMLGELVDDLVPTSG